MVGTVLYTFGNRTLMSLGVKECEMGSTPTPTHTCCFCLINYCSSFLTFCSCSCIVTGVGSQMMAEMYSRKQEDTRTYCFYIVKPKKETCTTQLCHVICRIII